MSLLKTETSVALLLRKATTNIAPGTYLAVLRPPGTRSLPGAFFIVRVLTHNSFQGYRHSKGFRSPWKQQHLKSSDVCYQRGRFNRVGSSLRDEKLLRVLSIPHPPALLFPEESPGTRQVADTLELTSCRKRNWLQ